MSNGANDNEQRLTGSHIKQMNFYSFFYPRTRTNVASVNTNLIKALSSALPFERALIAALSLEK